MLRRKAGDCRRNTIDTPLNMLRILAELRRSRGDDFNIFRRRINKISLHGKVEYPRPSPDIFPLQGAPILVLDAVAAHAPVNRCNERHTHAFPDYAGAL